MSCILQIVSQIRAMLVKVCVFASAPNMVTLVRMLIIFDISMFSEQPQSSAELTGVSKPIFLSENWGDLYIPANNFPFNFFITLRYFCQLITFKQCFESKM